MLLESLVIRTQIEKTTFKSHLLDRQAGVLQEIDRFVYTENGIVVTKMHPSKLLEK